MAIIHDEVMPVNTGSSWVVRKGQRIRIIFQSVMDFVVFDYDNFYERFDQARTKANQSKIFLSPGDVLYSKLNRVMMTITADTYKLHHDLQYGMCSKYSYDNWWGKRNEPQFREWFKEKGVTKREDLPLWGCYEDIMMALQNYPILPVDIPSPLNIGMGMEINPKTGQLIFAYTKQEPPELGTHIEFRAEMDCLCAGSCCPQHGKLGWAAPIRVQLFSE